MNDDDALTARHCLRAEPLCGDGFRPFGDVIEATPAQRHFTVNDGYAERYHDLARIDVGRAGGSPLLSIFRGRARALPLALSLVERHVLGSQAFVPMTALRFLVVVAPAGPAPRMDELRCFVAAPGQGVNYAPGVWHHPLLVIDADADFLVIDRGAPPGGSADCEEHRLDGVWVDV